MFHPKFNDTLASIYGMKEKSGDVGIELEVEGFNLPTEASGWTVKDEGSLRGKDGRQVTAGENLADTPREYVTKTPVTLSTLENKLANLHKLLTAEHVKVNLTPRASTHVHLNVGTETVKTFLAFLLLYAAVEPLLLRMCGPTRNGNLFCVPTYETGDLAKFVSRFVHHLPSKLDKAKDNPLYTFPVRGKYASLNTDPITTLGSVEVRCFPNTVDPVLVMKWASWLVKMRALARQADETCEKMLDGMYANPWALIKSIFGEENVYSAASPQHPTELVMYGIMEAYEVWREMRPLFDYKEPTKAEMKKIALEEDLLYDDAPQPSVGGMWSASPSLFSTPAHIEEL